MSLAKIASQLARTHTEGPVRYVSTARRSISLGLSTGYAAVNSARSGSAALRGSQWIFLDLLNKSPQQQIFSVAKIERRNASPAQSDVVLAFVNLTVATDEETLAGNWFNVDIDEDNDGINDLGIQSDHVYNVKNLAAYTGIDSQRRDVWQWATPRSGKDLLTNGVYVHLNRVPVDAAAWKNAPWEPLYLKLYDVTPAAR